MRFAVETHGCRLNQAETDALVEQLRARGHELVDVAQAQLYLLNSCAITHAADADARAAIRRARRSNPTLRVVITGCHANAEPDALAAMTELDAVLGNAEKRGPELLATLEQLADTSERLIAVERLSRRVRPEPWATPPAAAPRRTRPLLKVQDGCDQQCSFCIVPQVRGRSRSASLARAREQLGALVKAGAPEVVLTGAHLGSWGRDLHTEWDTDARVGGLAHLVGGLLSHAPDARLRLGSVDPHEVDDALVSWLAAGVNHDGAGLCQHVHLPVQSGDDQVLAAMRRAHRAADLEQLIPRLRAAAPHIALGTDVIVGFPGETEAAFERTLALLDGGSIPFAHVFQWSPRRHTAAVELNQRVGDRVAPDQAARRSRVLRERVAVAQRAFVDAMLGHERSAVVLRRRAKTGSLTALTDNFLRVRIEGPDALIGKRVRVRIEARADLPEHAGLAARDANGRANGTLARGRLVE